MYFYYKMSYNSFLRSDSLKISIPREQLKFAEKNLMILKSLYDHTTKSVPQYRSKCLPNELYIDQMDEEQIWQQLEMQNETFWNKCMLQTCKLMSFNENKLTLKVDYPGRYKNDESNNQNGSGEKSEENKMTDGEIDSDDEKQESDEQEEKDSDHEEKSVSNKMQQNNSTSVVDDDFFKLSEMESFLDSEDKKELDRLNGKYDNSGDIDYFESGHDDNESGKDLMFTDFFDTEGLTFDLKKQSKQKAKLERDIKNMRKEKEMKNDLGMEDSEAETSDSEGDVIEGEYESDVNEKSEFDMRQQRLQKRIEELEEKALADKPWQLKGEITSLTRPKNSLLEEIIEFDSVARQALLITEQTTMCLEDLIKRRIKSKAWDDVERKIKPINDQQDYRKKLVLQQEKSKDSLAQIYEKDYLEKLHKLNNVDETTKTDESPEHSEIRKAIKDLFSKLDALSNFHFTSKPIAAEAKIISNLPAIELEEAAPMGVSESTLLAPEEIRPRPVGDEIGKTERTDTDKKRERRKKKLKQKLIKVQNDKRIEEKQKLGIEVSSKQKQQHPLNQVTKGRNVVKVIITHTFFSVSF